MELELPYPPTVNHIWRRYRNRTVLSEAGREYRSAVRVALAAQNAQMIPGSVAVAIDAHPPDRRRRDLDNTLKCLLDALQHGGVYSDDSQIDDLRIRRRERIKGGRVRVTVTPFINPEPELKPPAADSPSRPRSCLKCSKTFDSTGPGNRICTSCNRKNARVQISEAELQGERGQKRQNGELIPSFRSEDRS